MSGARTAGHGGPLGIDLGSTWMRAAFGGPVAGAARHGVAVTSQAGVTDLLLRLGDPTPVVVGGAITDPTCLLGGPLSWLLSAAGVTDAAGQPVTVVVPAAWGHWRRSQVRAAFEALGVTAVDFVTSAVAVVRRFRARGSLQNGQAVVVFDMGGHSTHCAVARVVDGSVVPAGEPDGAERLGGDDLDRAVADLLAGRGALSTAAGVSGESLREACRHAREALSEHRSVTMRLPAAGGVVAEELTRDEFEAAAAPVLDRAVEVIESTVARSGLPVSAFAAVIAIGGVSVTPALRHRIVARVGIPLHCPDSPEFEAAYAAADWPHSSFAGGTVVHWPAPVAPAGLVSPDPPWPMPPWPMPPRHVPRAPVPPSP